MSDPSTAFAAAWHLVATGDRELYAVVALSLRVSLSALLIAALIGLPLGGVLAVHRFRGRGALIALFDTLMGLPPVVAGLAVYLLLSRAGPLGAYGLLFTPGAMIIAQTILITPIIAALTRQFVEDDWRACREQLTSLGSGRWRAVPTLLWNCRYSLTTAVLAGLGRAMAEVGAILIVGGNIAGITRTMTTAIALETSKGDLPFALGLGLVLMALILAVNGIARLSGLMIARAGPHYA